MPFKQILTLTLFFCSLVALRAFSKSENLDLLRRIDQDLKSNNSLGPDTTLAANSIKTPDSYDINNQELDSLFINIDTLKKTSRVQIGSLLSRLISNSKDYNLELGKLRLILSDTPDTTLLIERIPQLKDETKQLKEFTIQWEGEANYRYLKGVENFLKYIELEKTNYEKIISNRLDDLFKVGEKIDEIRSDSLLNLSLRDSTSFPEINKELIRLKTIIREIDSTLIYQELQLTKFQASISDLTIEILNLNQFFKESENKIKNNYWKKETNYLWEKSSYKNQQSLKSVILNSEKINVFVLIKYLNKFYLFFTIFLFSMALLYLATRRMIKRIAKKKEFADLILERTQLLKENLLVSFFVIGIPFYFLMAKNPPMVYISILSIFLVFFSTWLVKSHFGSNLFWKWILFLPVLIFSSIIALNWRVTYAERPFIYAIALITILFCGLILNSIRGKKFNGSSVLIFLTLFSIGFSIFSLGLNVLGRFSLAKVFAISGITAIYRGVSLYLFVQVVLKTVYFWVEASKKDSGNLTSFFDFQEIQKRLQGILNLLAFGLWIYAVLYHLGLFGSMFEFVLAFLSEERTLGNATFTFGTILLFFFILIFSQFLANNIAYFASIKDQQFASSRKKRIGSSILLIRLAIIIIGFLIAMTAAKIPLDKITIVLGALSVGIGFGLQTIINNLVSGIILAFERPIQIGDDIKIGELSGKVQEVGVRASKIRAYDGSDIVVPNGDLLSGQLINWTLSDKKRRIEIFIGVAYSSNMKLVKEIIEKQLVRDRILKNPAPIVLMENFGDNSVDFRVLFWVESMDFWVETKAEVMTGIFEAFTENGIEIPFPQRDLYLKSIPSELQEKVKNSIRQLPPEQEKNPDK